MGSRRSSAHRPRPQLTSAHRQIPDENALIAEQRVAARRVLCAQTPSDHALW
jgi:hypothetical protein